VNGPEAFQGLLAEVYSANDEKLHRLTIMGIRAILEQVFISKTGDHGSFWRNMEEFKSQGYISLIEFDQLRAVLDAGDAAIHRAFDPEEIEISTAFEVMERILGSIFKHAEDIEQISARVPPRRPRNKPPGSPA